MVKDTFTSFRNDEVIESILDYLTKEFNLRKSDVIRLAIYGMHEKMKENSVYKGINLKEIAKAKEFKTLRGMQSIERSELTSKATFRKRVLGKIKHYVFAGADTETIMELLVLYKKEAFLYKNNGDVLKEIDSLIDSCQDIDQLKINIGYYLQKGEVKKIDIKSKFVKQEK